jgi:hypothetical protein
LIVHTNNSFHCGETPTARADRDSHPQNIPIHIMVMSIKRATRRAEHKEVKPLKLSGKATAATYFWQQSARGKRNEKIGKYEILRELGRRAMRRLGSFTTPEFKYSPDSQAALCLVNNWAKSSYHDAR